jgi:hypothetical protein
MHGKPGGYLAYLGPGPAPVPGSNCTSRMTVLGVIVFYLGQILLSAALGVMISVKSNGGERRFKKPTGLPGFQAEAQNSTTEIDPCKPARNP